MGQKGFDEPYIMKKGLAIRDDPEVKSNIDEFWLLCSMPASGDTFNKYMAPDKDYVNVETAIKADPDNTATIKFTRTTLPKGDLSMELHDDASYVLYMSWGVFDDKTTSKLAGGSEFVLGDITKFKKKALNEYGE